MRKSTMSPISIASHFCIKTEILVHYSNEYVLGAYLEYPSEMTHKLLLMQIYVFIALERSGGRWFCSL